MNKVSRSFLVCIVAIAVLAALGCSRRAPVVGEPIPLSLSAEVMDTEKLYGKTRKIRKISKTEIESRQYIEFASRL